MILEKKIYFSKDIAKFLQISVETFRRRREQKELELSCFCKFKKVGKRYQIIDVYNDTYEKRVYNKALIVNDIVNTPCRMTTYKEMTNRIKGKYVMNKDGCTDRSIYNAVGNTARELFGTPKTRKREQIAGSLGNVKRIFAKYNNELQGYEYLSDEEDSYLKELIEKFINKHCKLTSDDVIEMICDREVMSEEEFIERTTQWFSAKKQDFIPLVIAPVEEKFGISLKRVSEFEIIDTDKAKRLVEMV